MRAITNGIFVVALTSGAVGCLDPTEPREPAGPGEPVVGSGNIVTETRPITGYHAIRLNGVGRLIVTQTGSESLTITADDNIVPFIESHVSDGELIITQPANVLLEPSQIIVYRMTVENLDAVSISGVFNATVDGVLAATFLANISGVVSLTVAGSATDQRVTVDGVSTYLAQGLLSETVDITGSGVMTVEVAVSDILDGDVCGAGTVTYVGSPTVLLRTCPGIITAAG